MGSGSDGAIEVEGPRLAWRTVGAGSPLLLVNGYGATSEDWDPVFLEALARSFEVICPDNRGVGGSELGEAELTVDGMADLEALLDALGTGWATLLPRPRTSTASSARSSPWPEPSSRPRRCGLREGMMDAWHRAAVPWDRSGEAPPILIAHGTSTRDPVGQRRRLAAHWLSAQVELFEACGHALMAQEPQRIADLIRAFAGR